jgi:hypothetical protein
MADTPVRRPAIRIAASRPAAATRPATPVRATTRLQLPKARPAPTPRPPAGALKRPPAPRTAGAAAAKPAAALPAWLSGVKTTLPAPAAARFAGLTLASESVAAREVKTLHLTADELPKAVAGIYSSSPAKARTFTKGVIANWRTEEQAATESRPIFRWAHKAGKNQRRMLIRAMNQKHHGIDVVDNLSELPRDDARVVMKDYFSEGGRVEDVVEWMRACGEYLRKEGAAADTDTDGIGRFFRKTFNAIKQGLKTVGDALKSAAKSLGDAIKKVVNWTAAQLRDLVIGLVNAGRRVGEILAEAVKQGLSVLGKFIRAVIEAGRRIADVVEWAAKQSLNTLKSAIQALKSMGKHLADILIGAVEKGAAIVNALVKGLIQIGEQIASVISAIAGAALSAVRLVTDALLKAGRTLFDIVNTAVRHALAGVGKIVQALLQLGRSVAQILGEVAPKLTPFFLRPVVNGLLQAGRKLGEIIGAAAAKGVEVLQRVTEAAIGLTKKLGEVIGSIVQASADAIAAVVKGAIAAGQKLVDVIREVKRFAGTQLRKLIQGLYKAVKKVGAILVEFARDTVNTIRMVLDGLLAAGVSLASAITSIVTDVAEGFRKGFFQGLIALAKSPAAIMKEALKCAGSVAALAFAVLLDVLGGHRPLNAEERKHARRVFGTSIDLDRVKVAVKSLPADLVNAVNGGRPFTTMYILNFASWKKIEMKTLIHELAHVWQGVQAGPVYMLQAIHAQIKKGDDAYKVTNDMLRDNGNRLEKFNREQQAVIAEEYWFNLWGHEVYPDKSVVGSWQLDTALLRPYALRFSGASPIGAITAATTAAAKVQLAQQLALLRMPKPAVPATPLPR